MSSPTHLEIVLLALAAHAAGSLLLIKAVDADNPNPVHHLRAAVAICLLSISTFPTLTGPPATPPDRRQQP
ncbi:hypothetical protein [Streptomyces omiyaensis]|uniref:hypothetical protein n=1 Tax=Streptomyces omiyaensis TaxID=68247 RepID=UPI0036F7808B